MAVNASVSGIAFSQASSKTLGLLCLPHVHFAENLQAILLRLFRFWLECQRRLRTENFHEV